MKKKIVSALALWLLSSSSQVMATENNLVEELSKRLDLHGVVEIEGFVADDYVGSNSSDIALATVELGGESVANDFAKASFLMKWEDDEFFIDEAAVTLAPPNLPVSITAGRIYLPFGAYETHHISDPITLDLGEIREEAIQIDYENGGLYASVYAFNGDTTEDGGEDEVEHFGANIGYAIENDSYTLDMGIGMISSIYDTDGLYDAYHPNGNETAEYEEGIAAYAILGVGNYAFIAEMVKVMEPFNSAPDGQQPMAYNLEVGYATEMAGMETTVAASIQGSDDAWEESELPETRFIASIGMGIYENTSLAIEWAHDEGDEEAGADTADKNADTVTVQLAYEF